MTNKTNIHELALTDAYSVNGGLLCSCDGAKPSFYAYNADECGSACCLKSGAETYTYGIAYFTTKSCRSFTESVAELAAKSIALRDLLYKLFEQY